MAEMKLIVSVCVRGAARRSDYSRSRKVLLRARITTVLEEQLLTACQDQNIRRSLQKVRAGFAEAPRKGGPMFVGSAGSPMEPKPAQAAAKH